MNLVLRLLGIALALGAAVLLIALVSDASMLTKALGLPVDGWEAHVVIGGFLLAAVTLAGGVALWRVSDSAGGAPGRI